MFFRVRILDSCLLFVARCFCVNIIHVEFIYIYIMYIFYQLSAEPYLGDCWLLLRVWACLVLAFLQIKRLLLRRTSPQKVG